MMNTRNAGHRDLVMRTIYEQRGLGKRISKELGLTYQAVSQWKRVPAEHVQAIAAMLDLNPEDIRPDIFKPRRHRGLGKP